MKHEIQDKLNILINNETVFNNDMDCVYFMVQIRKLLNLLSWNREYPIILFHSNWTVHSIIDRESSIRLIEPILKKLEEEERETLREMISMQTLREELHDFLEKAYLIDFTQNESIWNNFFENLTNVLSEQIIDLSNYKKSKVKSITYIKSPERNFTHLKRIKRESIGE